MEDDDIDLLLALQPDDAELGSFQTSPFRSDAAGSPPGPAGGTSARAYHSPEADKTSGPRSRVSLSAAFGTANAGIEVKAKVQKTDAPASKGEAPKAEPRQAPGKGDNIEAHSGLRIKNPLLPSIVVKERFAGARFLRLSKISSAFQGATPASPWATAAVLSEKMTPRESASGKKYGLWKVTDLAGFTCSLFLFGDAFEAHWKESEGSVVGLVNAKYKEENGGARSSAPFSLSADSGQQVFKLGTSADLGLCRGTRKDGMPCTMPINKSEGEYCQYHAAGAYQKLQKIQKAQEKGHRMDLGKGKLSREPHGRVLNNVIVSAPPAPLPRVGKSGAVNVVKPGQLQEMAELEQRKRSNSQGSRQALAVAASMQQQQDKKADKYRKKAPGKHSTDGPGAIRPGPAKAPLAASAGGGRGADVTKKDKVTSLPKLASAFDRQALAGKENLKRVAGATLGLDERERKRQQIERNRVRAEGNEARTGERGVRTGAEVSGSGKSGLPLRADGGRTERNGVRTELNGMRTENSEVPSGADGGRTERNSVRTELGGIRTEKSELPPGADGGRTDRNGMRTEPKVTRTVGDGNQTERNGNRTELDGQRTERNDVRTEADGKRTELNGPSDSVAGARDGSHEKRTTEQTERNEKSEDARSPYVPTEEKLQTEDGRGCSEADADRQKTGDQFGEGVRGKLTEEALRAALNTEDAEVPKLRIEKKTGSDGAGTQKREVGSQEVGGNKSEPRKEAGTGDPGKRGTVLNESKPDGKLGAVDVNGKEKEQGSQGNRVQTAAEKERGTKRGFSEELRRVVPDDLRPKETGERETLTQRKHRIAERVLRKQDRNVESLGRTSGDRPRADAPAASKRTSDDLDRTGGASEKRAKPDTAEQSAKRPKVISGSEKEGIEAMRRMNQGGVDVRVQDGGIRERHVAAGERGETATKRDTSGEKTGWTTGGDKGKVEGRKVGDAGIPGFQRSRDDVSKVAGPAAAGGKRVGAGEERRKDTGGSRTAVNEKPRGGSRRPAENAEMRPRVQERTAATAPGDGDRAKMKRRIFEELSELSVREREELMDQLRSSNKENRSIIAGQRIKKVSAASGENQREDFHGGSHEPRSKPAEGHVAMKKGFAAAFRDVAGVEEGPRESVFRDMGDAEEIERALGSFDILEKKEGLAAKMDKIQSVTVKGWRCDQCRRSTEKKPDLCVSDGHPIRFCPKLVKRFWACAVCKERTDTVGKDYPDVHCRKCDGMHFKPTGMRYAVPTKETPYAAKENFMARGKEHRFSLRDE